jgi:hypothetical protein
MSRLLKENPDALVYKLQMFTPFPGTELYHYAVGLGMKFPDSLSEWTTHYYAKLNYKGFNSRHKKFLEDISYYTTFLDRKIHVNRNEYLRFIAKIYSKLLMFRIERDFYYFLFELYLLKGGRRIIKKLAARKN